MRKWKNRKRLCLYLFCVCMLVLAFGMPVSAGVQEEEGRYEIYPTPQSITYGTGETELTEKVQVTLGSDIDSYTENRISETLEVLGLELSSMKVPGNTSLTVGVYGSGDEADAYGEAHGVDAGLYEKYDAYTLWIQGNDIVILGKDTDAAYYGVTTLKRIFEQLEEKSVKELTIKDYAEVEFRGFIEGYYGNPWSLEDRIDLMEFGGEIKMNQYVFAPKDDPYHNQRWRELYPEEELEKISALAQAGNESKCFFVYALHPFMNSAINLSDASYEAEVEILKAKFAQVIGAGVRQIAILEDDAVGESAAHIARLLNDMNAWLHEMKKTYPDLKTDILYCPTCYMSTTNSKLNVINKQVNGEIHFVMTGGKIWGEVSNSFADGFYNGLAADGEGRYPYMWVNWPCNDNTKTSQIMGGHNYILHTGVDGSKYEGIILNPIQESEPSKVGIFTAADYCWQTWDTAEEGDQAWEDAFKYIDHMTAIESEESLALKETAKHMISQGPSQVTAGKQAQFEESVELSPKISAFTQKLNAGTLTQSDVTEMRTELQKIADAAEYYLEKGTNRRMAAQMIPFLGCLHDVTQAGAYLMDSVNGILSKENSDLWGSYSEAQALYEKSKTYGFDYYGQGTIYAEAGRRYLTPLVEKVLKYVSDEVKVIVNPEAAGQEEKYTGTFSVTEGWKVYQGEASNVTDGDDSTSVWYNPTTATQDTSLVGDYIQLDLGEEKSVGRVRALVGASGSGDKWTKYHLAYSTDGENWTEQDTYTGGASGADVYEVNLRGARARYLRVINDLQVKKWVKFSEFSVYSYAGGVEEGKMDYTNTVNAGWEVEYGEDVSRVLPKKGAILKPGEYIGLKLGRIRAVTGITVTGAGTEKLTAEKSVNASEWKGKTEAGAARYIRLMNQTNAAVTFDLDSFIVSSNEIWPMDLLDTTISNLSASEDARSLGTTGNWMDGDLSTKAKYCGTPAKGDHVTYDLGQEVTLRSLRVYVLDTAIDYPRDAKIQASMDNENWTDILTIGDGIENGSEDASTKPVESDGGWIHDTIDVAYAYVENADIDEVSARYIRLYFTAGYNSRWVELNEIRINDGEYLPTSNDPTFETDAALRKGYEPQNLNDGDLTTAFQPVGEESGYVIYHLSDEKTVRRLNILQSGSVVSNAAVSVRTGQNTWKNLGTLDKSFSAFYTGDLEHVYAVKLEWKDTAPILYEIITLEDPGDLLDQKLEELRETLTAAKAAAQEAEKAVAAISSRVTAAAAKVNSAATAEDKLRAEIELQKLYAQRSAAEAAAAEKNAAAAETEAELAKTEASSLRMQAIHAGTEAEKARLEKEASEKDTEAAAKTAEAAAQKKLVTEKKQMQASSEKAAESKQKELDVLLKNTPKPEQPQITEFKYKNVRYKVLDASAKTAAAVGVTTKKVKAVTVYNTVKSGGTTWKIVQIGANAFKNCKKLAKVTIGSNVKKIGKQAFAQCTKLKNVNMKKAVKITSIGKKAFTKIDAKARFTVPAKKRKAYRKLLKKAGVPKKAVIK